jgi:cell division protein ZapA
MAPKPKRVEIDIFGQTFSLIADDEARLREVAKYVDAQMKELSQSAATIDSFRLAVLTALNLANERFDLADQLAGKNETIEAHAKSMAAKADRLSVQLDEALS